MEYVRKFLQNRLSKHIVVLHICDDGDRMENFVVERELHHYIKREKELDAYQQVKLTMQTVQVYGLYISLSFAHMLLADQQSLEVYLQNYLSDIRHQNVITIYSKQIIEKLKDTMLLLNIQ